VVQAVIVDEEQYNKSELDENRDHIIEAAIVRVMKMRHTLLFKDLVGEVEKQLSQFKPSLTVAFLFFLTLAANQEEDRRANRPRLSGAFRDEHEPAAV